MSDIPKHKVLNCTNPKNGVKSFESDQRKYFRLNDLKGMQLHGIRTTFKLNGNWGCLCINKLTESKE